KAQGLVFAKRVLESVFADRTDSPLGVVIPATVVVTTDVFDAFMSRNDLYDTALSDLPDDRIAIAFQQADFPVEHVGDLRSLVEGMRLPIAARSSSLLEDAMFRPFAGVYETKMIPNNQSDPGVRFQKLVEAIKFVYSSMFRKTALAYLEAAGGSVRDEKMAVVLQEVAGKRHGDRFYPEVSGVARSYNFYPAARAKPDEGVVDLALGLGKSIVDGGMCWTYSPAHPKAPPPFGSTSDLLKYTQLEFWAVNMGQPSRYDPIRDTEFLVKADLKAADYDNTLRYVASTYDGRSDRLVPGAGAAGAHVLNFAPLLQTREIPLNDTIKDLLQACEREAKADVEIEFALTLPGKQDPHGRFAFLQVRPMVVSTEVIEIDEKDLATSGLLLSSKRAMGNGVVDTIRDVVYVRPDSFEPRHTPAVAAELERINRGLAAGHAPYLLIGFGRWGSSDPWLGIPVVWGQIGGVKVLVEATLPNMNIELSQGSHFFHNLSSFGVSYLSVHHDETPGIDWGWLDTCEVVSDLDFVRHVRLDNVLTVKVDGRTGRGVVRYRDDANGQR
ncbi:MAG: PEP/pyruvate-binding domain-containing protein, partial [bacterium]